MPDTTNYWYMTVYFSVVASCFSTPCRPSVTFLITILRALSPENKTSKNLDRTNTTQLIMHTVINIHCGMHELFHVQMAVNYWRKGTLAFSLTEILERS